MLTTVGWYKETWNPFENDNSCSSIRKEPFFSQSMSRKRNCPTSQVPTRRHYWGCCGVFIMFLPMPPLGLLDGAWCLVQPVTAPSCLACAQFRNSYAHGEFIYWSISSVVLRTACIQVILSHQASNDAEVVVTLGGLERIRDNLILIIVFHLFQTYK